MLPHPSGSARPSCASRGARYFARLWSLRGSTLPPTSRWVLLALAAYASLSDRDVCAASAASLAALTGYDERTVERHLRALAAAGVIRRAGVSARGCVVWAMEDEGPGPHPEVRGTGPLAALGGFQPPAGHVSVARFTDPAGPLGRPPNSALRTPPRPGVAARRERTPTTSPGAAPPDRASPTGSAPSPARATPGTAPPDLHPAPEIASGREPARKAIARALAAPPLAHVATPSLVAALASLAGDLRLDLAAVVGAIADVARKAGVAAAGGAPWPRRRILDALPAYLLAASRGRPRVASTGRGAADARPLGPPGRGPDPAAGRLTQADAAASRALLAALRAA